MILFEPCDKVAGAFLGKAAGEVAGEFLQLRQVHGDGIVTFRERSQAKALQHAEGDAWICSAWGIPVAVRTADCVPILLAHPARVIAAVHAGWRGTRARILQKVLLRLREEFGLDLGKIRMAIGPAICANCYEIGEEVASELRQAGQGDFLRAFRGGKFLLDLKAANAAQAQDMGISDLQIERRSECTLCAEADFFSYRGAQRRGEENGGRNYSWLMISP